MNGCLPPISKSGGDIIDRRAACNAQASACREKAQAEPEHRGYWMDESIKWLIRFNQSAFGYVLTNPHPS
jgi:hypothetical protein